MKKFIMNRLSKVMKLNKVVKLKRNRGRAANSKMYKLQ